MIEKESHSQQMMLERLDVRMRSNETLRKHRTLYKNYLTIEHRQRGEIENGKGSRRKKLEKIIVIWGSSKSS